MSLNKFTGRGSNIDADDDRNQAVDREREADEHLAEHGSFEPSCRNCDRLERPKPEAQIYVKN
jgi:hypothetical protein